MNRMYLRLQSVAIMMGKIGYMRSSGAYFTVHCSSSPFLKF